MKFSPLSVLMAVSSATVYSASAAFVSNNNASPSRWIPRPATTIQQKPALPVVPQQSSQLFGTSSSFESDFASAMPEAPELTLREFLEQAADRTISNVQGSLGDGVDPVPELDALRKIRDDPNSSKEAMATAIYELMIERGMTYDEDADTGILTPTEFDIKANLDVPEVKEEFLYLYKYGMNLITRDLVSVEGVKKVVTERLISRTGLTPEEFDAWLGF